jgi:2-keto-4-pentenoate hydratase/2-oxohepta-3-ene-1,7-dioic acid hydratase in catechol pathway
VRIARFALRGEVSFGIVEGPPGAPPSDLGIAQVAGHPFAPVQPTGVRHALPDVRLLPPVLPSKVVCIGKNYADHVAEMGGDAPAAPLMFLKPSTSVTGSGSPVVHPRDSERVDYEGELAVVIGRLCKEVPRERAAEVTLGYTIGNDVTARDQQQTDGQWARAKGHDTFCPLGPWIETELDPSDLEVTTTLDGELRQSGRTSQLMHDIPSLISYVSTAMTLLPGDVLLTGTPAGVGPMRPGQTVTVSISGIGSLTNPVVDPPEVGL